jgi:uncharacterized iron-regulated membrane protein
MTAITPRRVMFWLHIWIGLILGIPFAALGVTGSVLVYEQQIDDALSPAPVASARGDMKGPQAIIDAAMAARPGARALILSWPQEAGDPAMVRLTTGGGRDAAVTQIYIDPVSLAVLDAREGFRSSFLRTVHDIHGSMMIGGREGRATIGWLGAGMLLLGLTGIVLWWPRKNRWKDAYGVKRGATGWLFYRQVHGTAGITAWLLFIVLSFTGIAIAFPQTISSMVRTTLAEGPSTIPVQGPGAPQIRVQPVEGVRAADADKALELAFQAAPDAHPVNMFLAQGKDQPIRVNMLPNGSAEGAPTTSVAVDPYRGEVVNVRDPWAGDLGDAVMTWLRPLHTGRGTNEIYKFAIFVVGLLPPLFGVTGTLMWWVKRRARVQARRSGEAMEGVPAE